MSASHRQLRHELNMLRGYFSFIDLGALNYLTKPTDKEKLKSSVEEALRQIENHAIAQEAIKKVFRMEKDTLISKHEYGKEIISEFIKCQKNSQIKDILLYMDTHYAEDHCCPVKIG